MYSNSKRLSKTIFIKIFGIWIVILMLLIPSLSIYSAPSDLNNNNNQEIESKKMNSNISNLPKLNLDYTQDGLSLFSPSERVEFQEYLRGNRHHR